MLEAAHERLQSENNNLRAKNKGMEWTAVTFNKVSLTFCFKMLSICLNL